MQVIAVYNGQGVAPGADKFAPKYLVGNVLSGDPAGATGGPFFYFGDPGDGSGIAAALAAAVNAHGDVWIRPGVYTYTGAARMLVPSYCHIHAAGPDANAVQIVSSPLDNCIFELATGAGLSDVMLVHSGVIAPVGTALVETQGPNVEVIHVTLDLQLAAPGGLLNAGILLAGNAVNLLPSLLERIIVLMPDGVGGAVESAWMVGVRGATVAANQHIALLSDVYTDRGDVGILTLGVEMELDACFHRRPRRMGWHASGARLNAGGRKSHINLTRVGGGELAGCQLINNTFALLNVRISTNLAQAIPAIYVSGGAGAAVALIDGCEIGTGFSPVIQIGNGAEVVQDTRVVNNRIESGAGVVPIAAAAGVVNSTAAMNVSRGSGATPPTDAGVGNQIAPGVANIWGA